MARHAGQQGCDKLDHIAETYHIDDWRQQCIHITVW